MARYVTAFFTAIVAMVALVIGLTAFYGLMAFMILNPHIGIPIMLFLTTLFIAALLLEADIV